MKTNNKAIGLLKSGISIKTLSKLNEGQIDILYKKLVSEQVTPVQKTEYKVGEKGGVLPANLTQNAKGIAVKPDPQRKGAIITPMEEEMHEEEKNPFSICTAQLGKEFKTTKRSEWSPKQMAKYERCVKDVKKSLKEGKKPISLFLENEIMRIVEKHLPPRITKGDLMKYLTEDGPAPAPAKPKTRPEPTTKPGRPQEKPKVRPKHPGKNPMPGVNPKPKAISPDKAKEEIIDLIVNLLEK